VQTVLDTRTEPSARRVLSAAVPEVSLKKLRLLFAGDQFDTWETGELIFKLPRTETYAEKIDREVAIHDLVAERLGALVPPIHAIGEPTEVFPFRCIAFQRARGHQGQINDGPIVRPKPWARAAMARDVANALAKLHKTPLRDAKASGVERRKVDLHPVVDASDDAVAWASRIAGPAVDAFLVDPLPLAARKPGAAVLCNTDLKGEHIFVSEDGGRITGIIDWADAAITDPAADFAGLAIWLGPAFVHEVLDVYTGPADEGTFPRAMFLARAGLLGFLGDQLSTGSRATALMDAQLRAVFSED
jgi:aminoglycoside phosphotransferase (APT) family kinase protein